MKRMLLIVCLLTLFFALPKPSFAYQTGQAASVVVGQPDFVSGSSNQGGNPNAQTLSYPEGSIIINNHLVISDANNARVLIYNAIPTSNNTPANIVIGQPDMTSGIRNQGGAPGANTLGYTGPLSTDGTKLIITDCDNNRFLIFNHLPTTNNASADVVIGQPDMTTTSTGLTTSKLGSCPWGAIYDNDSGKLVVTDRSNNRVLIYNHIPDSNGAAADIVVGDNNPSYAKIVAGKLIITDTNRVLIYNQVPTANGTPTPDVVIGQQNLNGTLANQGGAAGANTLNQVGDTGYDGKYLFIADEGNNRIVLFNGIPTTNNASAIKVLGQVNFINSNSNQGNPNPNASSFSGAGDGNITFFDNKVVFDDSTNHRVLIFQNDEWPYPSTSSSQVNPPDPNMLSGFKYQTMVGPNHTGPIQVVNGSTGAQDEKVILSSGISKDDIFISITKSTVSDLTLSKIPFPWQQGLNTVGDIYNFSSVSSFNGYLDNIFLKPVTVVLSYDPTKLNGHKPNQLRVAYYDLSKKKWIVLRNNTVVNYWNHTLANTTTVLSYMAVVYVK